MNEKTDTQAAIDAGRAIGAQMLKAAVDASPFVVIPDGYQAERLDDMLHNPLRAQAEVSVTDAGSFIAYVNKHKDSDATVIYADVIIGATTTRTDIICVLNDHAGVLPGWRDHTCHFSPKESVEWARWIGMDRKPMCQADFATWLEDNLGDISAQEGMPTGSQILEMAIAFEATAEHKLLSKVNLQNGAMQFVYGNEEDAKTRQVMSVFNKFSIAIPVFDGSTIGDLITARLKYTVKSGVVSFFYELVRPDLVYKNAVKSDLGAIQAATSCMVINGKHR